MQRTNERTHTNQEKDNTMTWKKKWFSSEPYFVIIYFSSDQEIYWHFLLRMEFSYLHRLIPQKHVCMCSDIHHGWVLNTILHFDMDSESKGRSLCEKKISVKFPFDI